jgi:hypothetical protein
MMEDAPGSGTPPLHAEVKSVVWSRLALKPELIIWVACTRGEEAWSLGFEVLPDLELRVPESPRGAEATAAAQVAAADYVANHRGEIRSLLRRGSS